MKRLLVCAILLLVAVAAVAAPTGMTGRSSSNMQVCTGSCALWWVKVEADGTNAVTVALYDGTSAAGRQVDVIYVPASYYLIKLDYHGVTARNGWYVTISGTNGVVSAGYQ
jgi:hypothetical protein